MRWVYKLADDQDTFLRVFQPAQISGLWVKLLDGVYRRRVTLSEEKPSL